MIGKINSATNFKGFRSDWEAKELMDDINKKYPEWRTKPKKAIKQARKNGEQLTIKKPSPNTAIIELSKLKPSESLFTKFKNLFKRRNV